MRGKPRTDLGRQSVISDEDDVESVSLGNDSRLDHLVESPVTGRTETQYEVVLQVREEDVEGEQKEIRRGL